MITEPGLFEVDVDTYLRDPCPAPSLNNSLIPSVLEAPKLAWYAHPRLNPAWQPGEPSNRMDLGMIAHRLLLDAGRTLRLIDFPDYRKQEAQARRDLAREAGEIPVLPHQLQAASEMVLALEQQLPFEGLDRADFSKGKKEVGLFWSEDPTVSGRLVWFRALIDWLRDDLPQWTITDYKTHGGSVNPDSMALSIHATEMGYVRQCAFQERGLTNLYPELGGRIKFRWLFQSTEPPYLISLVEPDPASMTIAHKQVERAFQIWSECLTSNRWPSYPKRVVQMRHAEHLAARWMERETADYDAGRIPTNVPPLKRRPGRPPKASDHNPENILAG